MTQEQRWMTVNHLPFLVRMGMEADDRAKRLRRRLRLLSCAICRTIWELLPNDNFRQIVEVAEEYADGTQTFAEFCSLSPNIKPLGAGGTPAEQAVKGLFKRVAFSAAMEAYLSAPYAVCWQKKAFGAASQPVADQERARYIQLTHDIFGNPFRTIAFSPEWRTDTAIALAQTMYEARDFSAMPILADALQDAGCENDTILSHCRGEGPHVRGCWVVDLVLGKA